MPRVYSTLGDRRRTERIDSLYTKEEKQAVFDYARRVGTSPAMLTRQAVLAVVFQKAATA